MEAPDITFSTGAGGIVTIHEPPEPIKLPAFGEWPSFWSPPWCRNGREVGAYFVGIVECIPEKCAHLSMPPEHVAGATHALVEGGLIVQGYSHWRGQDGDPESQTLEVRSQHHVFVE